MALMGKSVKMIIVDDWIRDIPDDEIRDWIGEMKIFGHTFEKFSSKSFREFSIFNDVYNGFNFDSFDAHTVKKREPIDLEVFEDERFPDCKVQVWEISGGKHDSLNPNPAAGPMRSYKITSDQSEDKFFKNMKRAKMEAQMLHIRLVKEAVAKATKALPANFGMF